MKSITYKNLNKINNLRAEGGLGGDFGENPNRINNLATLSRRARGSRREEGREGSLGEGTAWNGASRRWRAMDYPSMNTSLNCRITFWGLYLETI